MRPENPSHVRPAIVVVVVAEVRLYREGLVSSLSSRPGLAVGGAAADRGAAITLVVAAKPDVTVVDMATRDSLDLVREIREAAPDTKILAVAVDETEGDIFACAAAGVSGYLSCEGSMDDLVATIERCTREELDCSPRVTAMLFRRLGSLTGGSPKRAETFALTSRE